MSRVFSEQELVRRESLQKIIDLGIDPYPAHLFEVDDYSTSIKSNYDAQSSDQKKVKIAGRLMSRRIMGKAAFAELQDSKGRIQLYFNRDEICAGEDKTMYNDVFKKLLDIGDFIGVEGYVFTTKVGEISVHVEKFTVLSKTLRPLPLPKTDNEGNVYDAFTENVSFFLIPKELVSPKCDPKTGKLYA